MKVEKEQILLALFYTSATVKVPYLQEFKPINYIFPASFGEQIN